MTTNILKTKSFDKEISTDEKNPVLALYNNYFSYDNIKVLVTKDEKNNSWISANEIAELLKYENPSKSIKDYVSRKNIKKFDNIVENPNNIIMDAQKNQLFVNENGLYELMNANRETITQEVIDFRCSLCGYFLSKIRSRGYDIWNSQLSKQIEAAYRKKNYYKKIINYLRAELVKRGCVEKEFSDKIKQNDDNCDDDADDESYVSSDNSDIDESYNDYSNIDNSEIYYSKISKKYLLDYGESNIFKVFDKLKMKKKCAKYKIKYFTALIK